MVRAPCCEKMGLKKGPWTPEEDQILINYINLYGHGNWRALPKLAGLLRCGKSCRLRWTNYLRPDIKRGNFTREEEETIIKLHEMLGNRWSAIAARLPGRTDNEIKNVWHTHLKKRIKHSTPPSINNPSNRINKIQEEHPPANFPIHRRSDATECSSDVSSLTTANSDNQNMKVEPQDTFFQMDEDFWSEVLSTDNSEMVSDHPPANFPIHRRSDATECSSDVSSLTTGNSDNQNMKVEPQDTFFQMDEDFWSEVLSTDNSEMVSDLPAVGVNQELDQYYLSPTTSMESAGSNMHDNMEYFWYNLLSRSGELPDLLPDF